MAASRFGLTLVLLASAELLAMDHAQARDFAYAINFGTKELVALEIDSDVGDIIESSVPRVSTGNAALNVVANPIFPFVYVLHKDTSSDGVSAFRVNEDTGAISLITGSPFVIGPVANSVTVSPNGAFVFVTNSGNGQIYGFRVDPISGSLSAIPGSPFASGGTYAYDMVISPDGRKAYASISGDNGQVAVFDVAINGVLTPIPGSPFSGRAGLDKAAISPDGAFLYISDFQQQIVSAYAITPGTGALTPVPGSPFATERGPYPVIVHPVGSFVYVSNVIGTNSAFGSISAYRIDAASGALTPVNGSPFLGNQLTAYTLTFAPGGELLVAPHGIFLNAVSMFRVNLDTGVLSEVPGSPRSLSFVPAFMAILPTVRFRNNFE